MITTMNMLVVWNDFQLACLDSSLCWALPWPSHATAMWEIKCTKVAGFGSVDVWDVVVGSVLIWDDLGDQLTCWIFFGCWSWVIMKLHPSSLKVFILGCHGFNDEHPQFRKSYCGLKFQARAKILDSAFFWSEWGQPKIEGWGFCRYLYIFVFICIYICFFVYTYMYCMSTE